MTCRSQSSRSPIVASCCIPTWSPPSAPWTREVCKTRWRQSCCFKSHANSLLLVTPDVSSGEVAPSFEVLKNLNPQIWLVEVECRWTYFRVEGNAASKGGRSECKLLACHRRATVRKPRSHLDGVELQSFGEMRQALLKLEIKKKKMNINSYWLECGRGK